MQLVTISVYRLRDDYVVGKTITVNSRYESVEQLDNVDLVVLHGECRGNIQ